MESLDTKFCLYLEMLRAEGEPKSMANATLAASQHFLSRRRIDMGSCRLFAAWNRHEQAFQCRPISQEILIRLAGFVLSID